MIVNDGNVKWRPRKISGGGGVPVGSIQYFAGNKPPTDWLVCNGQEVSRTEYDELFEVIGTTYGTGDGSTTFNLPDLIGRFAKGGVSVGEKKEAGLPNITGVMWMHGLNGTNTGATSVSGASGAFIEEKIQKNYMTGNNASNATSVGVIRFSASNSNSIYGSSTTVQPASLVLLPIIKAR